MDNPLPIPLLVDFPVKKRTFLRLPFVTATDRDILFITMRNDKDASTTSRRGVMTLTPEPQACLFNMFCMRLEHSSFRNSSGVMNSGYRKSWCAPISLKLQLSCSRAQKYAPFSFTDWTNRCKALHVILNRSDVESFFFWGGGSGTAPWKLFWYWYASGFTIARILHAWTITKRTMG